MKECYKCKQSKPLTDFYKDYRVKGKISIDYYCKYCRVGSSIKSQRNNTKKCSIDKCDRPHYAKDWCRMHYSRWTRNGHTDSLYKPISEARTYIYDGKEIPYRREYNLMFQYKMTWEEFLSRSKNGCELCGKKEERTLHVDHNHKCCNTANTCGKCVRGILCHSCNKTVEQHENNTMRNDNPMKDKVIKYLEVYSGR